MAEEEKKYVWVTESFMHSRRPNVERYTLVRYSETGGATVKQYVSEKRIRPACGRIFFFDEEKLMKYLRKWMEQRLETARDNAASLADDLEKADLGVEIRKILDTHVQRGQLKTE